LLLIISYTTRDATAGAAKPEQTRETIWIMAEQQALSSLLLRIPRYAVLQQLCLDHETEEGVTNYSRYERLDGPLETMKDFVDLLRSENIIWIAEHGAFVYLTRRDFPELLESYQEFRFKMELLDNTNYEWAQINIHASTTQNAIACFEFLVGLQDNYYTHIDIRQNNHDDPGDRTCILTTHQLVKMLQNSNRSPGFWHMVFRAEHCRVLATCGMKEELKFYSCSCEDGGARFVQSYAEGNGPSKVSFRTRLPFNREHWALFLRQRNPPEYVRLSYMSFNLESSRLFAAAPFQCVELLGCDLEDEGESLIESVRTGLGPQGLSFLDMKPFTTVDRWISFMNALKENSCSLKLLKIRSTRRDNAEILQALADALLENNGLVELSVLVV
jgi:hypothetical protein